MQGFARQSPGLSSILPEELRVMVRIHAGQPSFAQWVALFVSNLSAEWGSAMSGFSPSEPPTNQIPPPPAAAAAPQYARRLMPTSAVRPSNTIQRMAAPLSNIGVLLDPKEAKAVVAYIHHLELEQRIREAGNTP
jgi:hypothetical protein